MGTGTVGSFRYGKVTGTRTLRGQTLFHFDAVTSSIRHRITLYPSGERSCCPDGECRIDLRLTKLLYQPLQALQTCDKRVGASNR